jgi:hypothetical protein
MGNPDAFGFSKGFEKVPQQVREPTRRGFGAGRSGGHRETILGRLPSLPRLDISHREGW